MERDFTFNISINKVHVDFKSENEVKSKYNSLKIINTAQLVNSLILLLLIVFESKENKNVLLYFAFLLNCLFNGLGFFQFIKILDKIPKLLSLKLSFTVYFLSMINYLITSIVCLSEKEFWIIVEKRLIFNLCRIFILTEIALVGILRLVSVYLLVKVVFLNENERKRINSLSDKDRRRFFSVFATFSYNMLFDSIYVIVVSVFILKFTHLKFTFMDVYIGSIGGILLSSSVLGLVIGILLIINALIKSCSSSDPALISEGYTADFSNYLPCECSKIVILVAKALSLGNKTQYRGSHFCEFKILEKTSIHNEINTQATQLRNTLSFDPLELFGEE
ncbi:hypothetical protein FG386_002205 [Cryptosporidium ryanae]|uniref:uncharacterized protein n=1 Tax=Cryptosporidium ryanae TaxID=515981 RepID=UPI00351A5695|nr:hypothetical protein FG386_002205 [Cryptosporidium ryanae]